MTLYQITNSLLNIARTQHNIGYVGEGDIYSLNTLTNLEYGVFFVTQTNHSQSEDRISYTFTLYYVDRLLPDNSNKLQIQSNGIITLGNIINRLAIEYDVDVEYSIKYTTFIQKFIDMCSGVFATITVSVDNNIGLCSYM